MLFDCRPKIFHKHCLQFLLGVTMVQRETENNAYAKFWGDKQRTLWYVMVFLEWSNCRVSPVKFTQFIGRAQRICRTPVLEDGTIEADIVMHSFYQQQENYHKFENESFIKI